MTIPVHILATCRNAELLPATLMVFRTLRTGFPRSHVTVHWNGLDASDAYVATGKACDDADVDKFKAVSPTIHHQWIASLVEHEPEPFFICDTDVAFWREFGPEPTGVLSGKFVPEFFDKFTNCITRSRLHTSLLYIDPEKVKAAVAEYFAQFPDTPFNPRPNLFNPSFHPVRTLSGVRNYFSDTCSMLFHAIGGVPFTDSQLDCYDHLHFGTISDLVAPHYPEYPVKIVHRAILNNPELLRGAWKTDANFYQAHPA